MKEKNLIKKLNKCDVIPGYALICILYKKEALDFIIKPKKINNFLKILWKKVYNIDKRKK